MEGIILGSVAFVITILLILITTLTNEKNKINEKIEKLDFSRVLMSNAIKSLEEVNIRAAKKKNFEAVAEDIIKLKMTRPELEKFLEERFRG